MLVPTLYMALKHRENATTQLTYKISREEAERLALDMVKKARPEARDHSINSTKLSGSTWNVSGYCREGQDSTRFEVDIDAASGNIVGTDFRTYATRVG